MKRKLTTLSLLLFAGILFFSCASGTYLVTGTQRDAISAEEVQIYVEEPDNYEVIGVVNASSDAGWTEQGCLNYAVAELKKQAAKIGANGVVIINTGKSKDSVLYSNGIIFSDSSYNVSGKAIYVYPEQEKTSE